MVEGPFIWGWLYGGRAVHCVHPRPLGVSVDISPCPLQARSLVDEMQQRLSKEIQEREAEAALYSARLYESEKQMSDWWVPSAVSCDTIAH